MFAQRALRVTSWSGTNLLGGGDGETLSRPERAAAKIDSKDRALRSLLGHPVGGESTSTTSRNSASGRRPGTT